MCGTLTLIMVLSRISMNGASVAAAVISQGLVRGRQAASIPTNALTQAAGGGCVWSAHPSPGRGSQ